MMWRTRRAPSRKAGWLGLPWGRGRGTGASGAGRRPGSGRSGRRGTIRRSAAWAATALMAATALAGAGMAVIGVGRWWSQWEMPSPPVREVRLQGLQRLSAEEVRRLLPFREGDRLFGLPLGAAAQRLSSHPWIARAALHRSLSGSVVVRIQERQPVAVLIDGGAAWFVDAQGALLGPAGERPGPEELAVTGVSLPQLRAGAAKERRRLQEGLTLLALVRRDGVDAAVVTMRPNEEAVMTFGGWRLHFSAGHYEEQWRRFWQVADRIPADPKREDRLKEIDLRFGNSVVVKSL